MRIGCILTASNDNPLYMEFIPIFIKSWSKLVPEATIKIIFIASEIPSDLIPYSEYLIHFLPIPGVSTSFTSQYVRILYPAIIPDVISNFSEDQVVLITDMDMLPANRSYYVNAIENVQNDKFVCYRNVLAEIGEYAMCYNAAHPKIWKEVFQINTFEDVVMRLIEVHSRIHYANTHGGSGWNRDQVDLYSALVNWNKNTGRFICLKDNEIGYNRLDRIFHFNNGLTDNVRSAIRNELFSDYHALRPYSQYKQINDEIAECLRDYRA